MENARAFCEFCKKILLKIGMDTTVLRETRPGAAGAENKNRTPEKPLKNHLKVIIRQRKAPPKQQRKSFDFNRNVTKTIRDAQFLRAQKEQNAKTDAKIIKVIL